MNQNKEKTGKEGQETADLVWQELRTEHIVQDPWIDFRRSAYQFPDGRVFEPFYSYSRKDYVVIVASDEQGNYLCVRQFRQGIKEVTTEFPAGGIERKDGKEYGAKRGQSGSEDAWKAAKRELFEETGYESNEWKHLLTVPSNATIADNYAYIFTARNCYKSGNQHLDETEFLNVRKYAADEIEKMIYEGSFQQAVHIMAWLLSREDFKIYTLRKALVKSYLGKITGIKVDRPSGSAHPKHADIIYPVNYGYIPGIFGGDGEELDVYLLGIDKPVKEYTGRIIAIIHREDDVEDKLVMAPEGVEITQDEVAAQVHFQEQYYKTKIEMWEKNQSLYGKSGS